MVSFRICASPTHTHTRSPTRPHAKCVCCILKHLGEDAFNATVRWGNGSTSVLCRRQRPQVVMAEDGMPGWLWTGVMDGPRDGACDANPTWTLAQQIGRYA